LLGLLFALRTCRENASTLAWGVLSPRTLLPVKLDLIIDVPGHPEHEVKHGETVPLVLLGRLTNRSRLPVKVDPNHPSHFLIKWERA
jgi:hypothetical protein